MSNFISFKGFNWEYETFGEGTEPLLAFHGFGNQASDFKVLLPSLGQRFKIISFYLPFHGKSQPDLPVTGMSFSNEDLKELFKKFINENSIKAFSVMGYSLGGKIALKLIEFFPDRINTVFLFASDGIGKNPGYNFVTKTFLGKRLYLRIIDKPAFFFRILNMLKGMKLIAPKLADFVHYKMSTREKRKLVWDVWMCLRNIKPDIRSIQRIINNKKIIMHLFFGNHDKIIRPVIGKKFIRGLDNKNTLHIVEAGHNLIKDKMNNELAQVI